MPKIVDHELQREKVAQAAWRVIQKHGIEQASVRKIADEAGVSAGSMRHYFNSQSELYAYSMRLVSKRVNKRIEQMTPTGNIMEDAALYVEQILPLHEETSLEMEVWLAFVVKSLSDPSLSELRNQVDDELRQMFRILTRALIDSGAIRSVPDEDLEIERMYALVDGLAIHAIQRPEVMPAEKVKAVLRHHLSSL